MNIKEARKSIGLTQKALSQWLGIPSRTVEAWDSGYRSCPDWCRELIVEKILRDKGGHYMLFTELIEKEPSSMEVLGYRWAEGGSRKHSEVVADLIGENRAYNELDAFSEGFNQIYKGMDGKLYAVGKVLINDKDIIRFNIPAMESVDDSHWCALCWREVEKI